MKKEHAYKQIEKDIQGNCLKNVVLFYGREQYLVKWAVNRILEKYVHKDCRDLDFSLADPEKVTIDSIIESCETLTLLSEKRIVYLPDFVPLSGSGLRNFPEESVKELSEYIKKLPDTCILILAAETVDKRKKLYKEIASLGGVYHFESLDESTLRGFIEKRFRGEKKKINPSVIREFSERVGYFHKESTYTLYHLNNDIKKIAAHCDGEEVLLSDVVAVVAGDLESNVFAMVDAVSRNRKEEAYRLLHNLLGSGSSVFMILALLASQFELLLEVKELRAEGRLMAQMQSVLNIHEFRIKKAGELVDRYTFMQLRGILKKIYQVEKNIKGGFMDQTLALEMLIAEV